MAPSEDKLRMEKFGWIGHDLHRPKEASIYKISAISGGPKLRWPNEVAKSFWHWIELNEK